MSHSSFYISAAHKSSGKTSISIGLCAAFAKRGLKVQPFKKGPDYIDPLWLGRAAEQACYNLDFNVSADDEIKRMFYAQADGTDISLVEGNKGLFDGLALNGCDSNAALANLLNIPVVLVLDTVGITRGVVPLLLGYQNFPHPSANIAGVILNKVGGTRHEHKLLAAIAEYTDFKVFGAVHKSQNLAIKERHLGLVPSNEDGQSAQIIHNMAEAVAQSVNLDELRSATVTKVAHKIKPLAPPNKYKFEIAVARDSAFGFYYQSDFDEFVRLGARLKFFSILADKKIPQADGVFIGGGFPETHAPAISNNHAMLADIKQKITANIPVYAECGGLMILARNIQWQDKKYPMANVIDADCLMQEKPQGRGFVKIKPTENHLWQMSPDTINAHEFHYSSLVDFKNEYDFSYEVVRGAGIKDQKDGLIINNLLANYSHLRAGRHNNWVEYFLRFVSGTYRATL